MVDLSQPEELSVKTHITCIESQVSFRSVQSAIDIIVSLIELGCSPCCQKSTLNMCFIGYPWHPLSFLYWACDSMKFLHRSLTVNGSIFQLKDLSGVLLLLVCKKWNLFIYIFQGNPWSSKTDDAAAASTVIKTIQKHVFQASRKSVFPWVSYNQEKDAMYWHFVHQQDCHTIVLLLGAQISERVLWQIMCKQQITKCQSMCLSSRWINKSWCSKSYWTGVGVAKPIFSRRFSHFSTLPNTR